MLVHTRTSREMAHGYSQSFGEMDDRYPRFSTSVPYHQQPGKTPPMRSDSHLPFASMQTHQRMVSKPEPAHQRAAGQIQSWQQEGEEIARRHEAQKRYEEQEQRARWEALTAHLSPPRNTLHSTWSSYDTQLSSAPPSETSHTSPVRSEKAGYPVQQPPMIGPDLRNAKKLSRDLFGKRRWNSELGASFNRCDTCCLAAVAPCVLYGELRTRLQHLEDWQLPHPTGGESFTFDCVAFACLMPLCLSPCATCRLRREVRDRYAIRGSPGLDLLASTFCGPCAATQLSAELEDEEILAHEWALARNDTM